MSAGQGGDGVAGPGHAVPRLLAERAQRHLGVAAGEPADERDVLRGAVDQWVAGRCAAPARLGHARRVDPSGEHAGVAQRLRCRAGTCCRRRGCPWRSRRSAPRGGPGCRSRRPALLDPSPRGVGVRSERRAGLGLVGDLEDGDRNGLAADGHRAHGHAVAEPGLDLAPRPGPTACSRRGARRGSAWGPAAASPCRLLAEGELGEEADGVDLLRAGRVRGRP